MTLILMMRLERMNAGRGDDVACSGGTTAEMNVDSRGYVNIQAAEVRSEMTVRRLIRRIHTPGLLATKFLVVSDPHTDMY